MSPGDLMNIDIPDEDRSDEQKNGQKNPSRSEMGRKGLQLNQIFFSLSAEDQDKVIALATSLARKVGD